MNLIIAKIKNNQNKKVEWGVFEKKSIFNPMSWILSRYTKYGRYATKKEAEERLEQFKIALQKEEWLEE